MPILASFNWKFFLLIFFALNHFVFGQLVDDLIDASITAEAKSIKLGDGSQVIVEVNLAEGWHIYSNPAGESGYPTTIDWDFPKGVQISEPVFPKPISYESEGTISFVHNGKFILKSDLETTTNASFENDLILLKGTFSALVCSAESCIPYDQDLSLEIPISSKTILNNFDFEKVDNQELISPVFTKQILSNSKIETGLNQLMVMFGFIMVAMGIWLYGKTTQILKPSRSVSFSKLLSFSLLALGVWVGYPNKSIDKGLQIKWEKWSPEKEELLLSEGRAVFIDFTARWCASCQINKRVYEKDSIIEKFHELDVVALQADWTKRGPVILKALQKYGREGVPLYIYHPPKVSDKSVSEGVLLPEILTGEIVLKALEGAESFFQTEGASFLGILGFAFIGGLILNLMPCVFPVIGLKIMSFVKQAGEDPQKIRMHGLVFTFGVVLSFWILVGILLGLRESFGDDIGWGFQLQEPIFVFVLAVFLFIFALSLSGVFDIGLSMTGVGGKLSQKSGYLGSFFSGFLATVVATPCMAPFLGVAVGAALAMSWLSSIIVFTSIALGLSTPYLLLSIYPKWISSLPKPGAWMDTLKQAMAFPLYATVAWLLWTLNSLI